MDKTQGLKVTRRSILKTIPALSAISAGSSFFTKAACAQEPLEDGYTICDNCNQMPMCGIHFQRQGNVVVSVGNWKEHSGKLLCNKALATLQRLYNPNRLLYPMKRTNPKGSADPGFVRISWQEALATIAANMKKIRDQYGAENSLSSAVTRKNPVLPQCVWHAISVLITTVPNLLSPAVKAPCLPNSSFSAANTPAADAARRQNLSWSWLPTVRGLSRTAGGT